MTNLSTTNISPSVSFKALIMAGGTGGHIFPGLAIARELQSKGWKTNWLGSIGGMESQIIGDTDIPLNLIEISGLRGNGLAGWIRAPFVLLKAIWQAANIIRKIKPDVVIGFGGFASGPGGLAAFVLRKPLFIHEQNAVAGMTNKTLAIIARRVFLAFPNAMQVGKNCQIIGNPIRREIVELCKGSKVEKSKNVKTKLNLLVIGGSRGAKVFNEFLPSILAPLIKLNKISLRHQSGSGNLQSSLKIYAASNIQESDDLKVEEFISNMNEAYRWADLVICRAGALTVSEIAAVGIAAIFVPFPYAVDDHQSKNALWLVEQEAAVLMSETELHKENARQTIMALVENPEKLERMGKQAKNVAYLDATQRLTEACELLMKEVA